MEKPITKKGRLVAAMSGGVDSSVAAAIILKQGYEVIGVTLRFIDCSEVSEKQKSCCGSDDKRQVLKVCEKLGIPHHFLDMRELFEREVLRKCWEEYSSGRTPNPCVLCNRHIKFKALLEYSRALGAEGIITGHYAKIAKSEDGEIALYRGKDKNKDQSYFLSLVRKEDLALTHTPLAEMEKSEVRNIARDIGLPNADKRESQDACVGMLGENFAETLRRKFNGETRHGNFIDQEGKILGKHNGIHNFTIGQRRGFGKGFGRPVFVKEIRHNNAEVVLCYEEKELFKDNLIASDMNWIAEKFIEDQSFEAEVQIRYRSKAARAEIKIIDKGKISVRFNEAQRAITPGQAAAVYIEDRLIGGGIIQTIKSDNDRSGSF